MATSQSKYGRRFDEEFKREVAALACRPGARQQQVARDLGVSPYSVSRWKKLYGGGEHAPSAAAPAVPGVSVQELERRIRALERECADLREQRTILKKAVAISPKPRDEDGNDPTTRGAAPGANALPRARRGA